MKIYEHLPAICTRDTYPVEMHRGRVKKARAARAKRGKVPNAGVIIHRSPIRFPSANKPQPECLHLFIRANGQIQNSKSSKKQLLAHLSFPQEDFPACSCIFHSPRIRSPCSPHNSSHHSLRSFAPHPPHRRRLVVPLSPRPEP